MLQGSFSRLGAASGAGFIVLVFAAGDSDSTVAVALELVGLVLIVPFLAYLRGVLRAAEGPDGWLASCAFGAGLVDVTIKMASIAPGKAADNFGSDTAVHQALVEMNDVAFIVTMLPLGIMMAAVAAVTLRFGGLPRWLGWMAAVISPLLLINGMFLTSADGPAFLLFMLWILLASIVLTVRHRPAEGIRTSDAARVAG
jgi:hypothetical protein